MSDTRKPRVRHLTQALIDDLDTIFPDRCPNVKDSERAIWVAVGARKVIDFLINEHHQQDQG